MSAGGDAVGRRLVGLLPRRVLVALGAGALVQGALVVAQADLLARAIAGLQAGLLVGVAVVVAARGLVAWAVARAAGRWAAVVKRRLREGLLVAAVDGPGAAPGLVAASGAASSAGAGAASAAGTSAAGRSASGASVAGGGAVAGAGARVTLLTRGLEALDPFFTGYVPQLVAACAVPVVVWGRLVAADWASGLVVAVTVPLVPVFGALVGMRSAALTRRQWALLHRLGGHFRDVLAGLGTLRAHGRVEHQSGVVRRMADEHRRASVAALRVAFLSSLVLELVCALSVALVAVPVGLRLLDGRMALATGLLVLLLTPEVYLPLRALGTRFHASAEGVAAAREVFAVLDAAGAEAAGADGGAGDSVAVAGGAVCTVREPQVRAGTATIADADTAVHSAAGAGGAGDGAGRAPEIVFEEVTVRYPGARRPALEGVSLRVAAGERVALTGPSGAGKSTLLLVALGLCPVESGRVLVDGVELSRLGRARWRRRVGWVPQRPHLFAASVADNIRLGAPEADMARVERAARAAGAAEFVAGLPDGYGTVLGEGGAGLSAGQRQRLALARAYLVDAAVMLLDEPTARLDVRSERSLVEAAGRVLEGRTALVVAHRAALLSLVDRVVRLEGGRVVRDFPPPGAPSAAGAAGGAGAGRGAGRRGDGEVG